MKKCLILVAALALAGCYHADYKARYLQKYAGYDCVELRLERLVIESRVDPKWRESFYDGNSGNSVVYFQFNSPNPIPGRMEGTPISTRKQKRRMRNHARWQALVQLERMKGCRNDGRNPPSMRIVPKEIRQ